MAGKFLFGLFVVGCLVQLTLCSPQQEEREEEQVAPTDTLQERQGGGYGAPPPSYGPQSSWAQPSPGPSYGQSLPPPSPPQTYNQPPPPEPSAPPPSLPPTTYGQSPPPPVYQPPPPPVYQPPPPEASTYPSPPPPPPPSSQPPSAYGSTLTAGAGPAPVQDFYAPVPPDSPSMGQLFGPLSDGGPLTAGYGKPDQDQVVHGDVQVLPPVEETKEGETHYYNHVYPEVVKNNEIVSNKEINTYSVQKHRINVNNRNIHQYVKNVRVNTDYITNIKRINHPHQQVQVLTYVHNRYVPKLYVKHSRNDIVNELPPQEVPTVETQQSVQVLPPIIEKPIAQKIDYNGQVVQTLDAAGTDAGGGAFVRSGLDAGGGSGSGGSADSGSSSSVAPSSAAPPTTSSFPADRGSSSNAASSQSSSSYSSSFGNNQQQQQQSIGGNSADASITAPNARNSDAAVSRATRSNYNWPQTAKQQAAAYQRQLTVEIQQRRQQPLLQQRFIPSPQLLVSTQPASIAPTPQSSPSTVIPTYRSSLLTADVQQLKSITDSR